MDVYACCRDPSNAALKSLGFGLRPRGAFPLTGRPPVISPDGAESGLPAELDQGHVGIGEAEMVTDLVDQHVADDAVHWLAVSPSRAQRAA